MPGGGGTDWSLEHRRFAPCWVGGRSTGPAGSGVIAVTAGVAALGLAALLAGALAARGVGLGLVGRLRSEAMTTGSGAGGATAACAGRTGLHRGDGRGSARAGGAADVVDLDGARRDDRRGGEAGRGLRRDGR